MPNTFDQDTYFTGNAYFTGPTVQLPNGSIGDAQHSASSPVTAAKLEHQYQPTFQQPHGTAATSERRPVHRARNAGTVVAFVAGAVVPNVGAATVTVNLLKNGTTVLSAVVTLNNSQAAFAAVVGSISSAAYVAGDVFEVQTVATAGGGTLAQGVFAAPVFREAA